MGIKTYTTQVDGDAETQDLLAQAIKSVAPEAQIVIKENSVRASYRDDKPSRRSTAP